MVYDILKKPSPSGRRCHEVTVEGTATSNLLQCPITVEQCHFWEIFRLTLGMTFFDFGYDVICRKGTTRHAGKARLSGEQRAIYCNA